ncbi:hypothetical protein BDK51DRAFT_52462 [Blyttiomyces helicus]|uniref:DUF4246 domain-containing protein n=1 Tax=Blyttiomyces helicus TaxID=388810 RepID=A0A4P9WEV6_9FUNG|nr:hypothetical protein BDK51DRAFT_52462 [Blyttiomyces helicus]|eukprot:RKO90253.1 hypothetical protein BDK51DRAFT_52462 [Blyttiomyces helicus]
MEWRTAGRVVVDPRSMMYEDETTLWKADLTPKECAFLKVWDRRHDLADLCADGLKTNVFMGTIPTPAGRILTFPNTLQYKVAGVSYPASATPPATRKILCFFFVDPDLPITSTADVAEQQWETVGPEIYAVIDEAFRRTRPQVGCPILVFELIASFAGLDRVRWDDALRAREEVMAQRSADDEADVLDELYNLCEH